MANSQFIIELRDIHWVEGLEEQDDLDLCAHGKVLITIGNEIVADNTENNFDCALTASSLHLLRSLESNHTKELPVGERLIPGEGHCLIPIDNNSVHVATAYPNVKGWNWWVIHEKDKVRLITESKKETVISFESYKNQIINFVDKVDYFYKTSKPKTLPHNDEDEKEGYLRLRNEWKKIRNKYT
jgi:hypothetical protein